MRLLALTTLSITAAKAYEIGLIDFVESDFENTIQFKSIVNRLQKIDSAMPERIKKFYKQLDGTCDKEVAIAELDRLIHSEFVQKNIQNYRENETFPWEKGE